MRQRPTVEPRRYRAIHALAATTAITAIVQWTGTTWNVHVNDEPIPDCCDTIEEAYTVAEREILRRFPDHDCGRDGCRSWHLHEDEG